MKKGERPSSTSIETPTPTPPRGSAVTSLSASMSADGSFGTAVPVAELNTDATDQRPSVAHSGLDIFFYSNRPGSTPKPRPARRPTNIWGATRESVLTVVGSDEPRLTDQHRRWRAPSADCLQGRNRVALLRTQCRDPAAIDLDLFVSTRTRIGNAP